ncbi:MAG: ArsC family reductase [Spongiibacter sp.]|uniref:ArsC family reductase n=1 Tax=Spongiibacter thalassae TaxID=2721624 RepID=A0ABX1GEK2_9GAMM|nr:ArsC family reductase [Spongiibacter thalassae]MDX1504422.1 ArsC family reductase [Spongiibacter sp.]NKI17586.1 ArsC family reductase [Spongiibacter thalassae]
MSITLYGIKNCDTVRSARRWLDNNGIEHRFQDVRDEALTAEQLSSWLDTLGVAQLVNKRSTTWKQLSDEQRASLDNNSAVQLLLEHPTLMKRPLLDTGKALHLGFKAEDYDRLFSHHTL